MRAAKFIVEREGSANNKYVASNFFQTIHAGNAASGPWFTNDQCGKTIVWGTTDAGINNVIYTELNSGPKMANGTCGKTIVAGTIDRGSTVYRGVCKFWHVKVCLKRPLQWRWKAFVEVYRYSVCGLWQMANGRCYVECERGVHCGLFNTWPLMDC